MTGSGRPVITMVHSAEPVVRNDATQSYGANPAVRCPLPESEMRAVVVIVTNILLSAAGNGAGSALSYGRRTSDIMSLNLAGSGGLPQALGSTGAQGFFQTAGKWLNLGLDEAEKFAVGAGLAGAEAFNCAIPR